MYSYRQKCQGGRGLAWLCVSGRLPAPEFGFGRNDGCRGHLPQRGELGPCSFPRLILRDGRYIWLLVVVREDQSGTFARIAAQVRPAMMLEDARAVCRRPDSQLRGDLHGYRLARMKYPSSERPKHGITSSALAFAFRTSIMAGVTPCHSGGSRHIHHGLPHRGRAAGMYHLSIFDCILQSPMWLSGQVGDPCREQRCTIEQVAWQGAGTKRGQPAPSGTRPTC